MQKFWEHEQASTSLKFASKSSKGNILRAVKNFNGPFITPLVYLFIYLFIYSLIHLIIFIPYACASEISGQKPTSVPGPSPTRYPEQEREQVGLFILPLLDSIGKGTEHLNIELYELNVNKGNFNFFSTGSN